MLRQANFLSPAGEVVLVQRRDGKVVRGDLTFVGAVRGSCRRSRGGPR